MQEPKIPVKPTVTMAKMSKEEIAARLNVLTDMITAYIKDEIGIPLTFVLTVESDSAISYLSNLKPKQGEDLLMRLLCNLRIMQEKDPSGGSYTNILH